MDLVDQTNRCIKVRIEELESKIRSKKDLYYVLRQWCKHIIYIKVNTIYQMKIIDQFGSLKMFCLERKDKKCWITNIGI